MHAAFSLYLLWCLAGGSSRAMLYDRRLLGAAWRSARARRRRRSSRAIFEGGAVALLATYAAVLFPPRWLVKKR